MSGTAITDGEFRDLLRSFRESAFYLEARDMYALDYEAAEFEHFRKGDNPLPPTAIGWWKDWLDQIADLTRQGKRISRVRVIAEPPSDYQRWGLWALPWHTRAGEQISYLTHRQAHGLGLPDADWWLLDDERVIIMGYDDAGHLMAKTLVTDPELLARYRDWRDLAVRNATPAEEIAAA